MRRLVLVLAACTLAYACAATRPCECCFPGGTDAPAANFLPLSR